MTPEQKIKKNEKAMKEKFLEDYFSLCREHGFCVAAGYSPACADPVAVEYITDFPAYDYPLGPPESNIWENYKKDLRRSL